MEQSNIDEALQGLETDVVATLLTRIALRGLPLLAAQEAGQASLACWPEPVRAQSVLALFRCCQQGVLWALGKHVEAHQVQAGSVEVGAADETAASVIAAATLPGQMLGADAESSFAEMDWRFRRGPAEPVDAADAAVLALKHEAGAIIGRALRANPMLQMEVLQDFQAISEGQLEPYSQLREHQRIEALRAQRLIQLPLWAVTPAQQYSAQWELLKSATTALNPELAIWLEWLEAGYFGASWQVARELAVAAASELTREVLTAEYE